ncbi:hypothetical protein ABZ479_29960 [Streptomyces sp. NPDC005722]
MYIYMMNNRLALLAAVEKGIAEGKRSATTFLSVRWRLGTLLGLIRTSRSQRRQVWIEI